LNNTKNGEYWGGHVYNKELDEKWFVRPAYRQLQ
jgi:hypothetical protein